jgi:hypothetical protein
MGAPGSAILGDTEVSELLCFLNICRRNFGSFRKYFLTVSE